MDDQVVYNGRAYVRERPRWIERGIGVEESMRHYSRLTKFYVVGNPVPGLSARRLDLKDLGWDAPWSKPEYLNRKMKDTVRDGDFLWSAEACDEMEEALRKADMLDGWVDWLAPRERAALHNCKKNQMMSLLYHVRNSLCHGRFTFFKRNRAIWIALEDVKNPGKGSPVGAWKQLSARMVLRYSTLLSWQELILAGPK